jgi:hypothetical protein
LQEDRKGKSCKKDERKRAARRQEGNGLQEGRRGEGCKKEGRKRAARRGGQDMDNYARNEVEKVEERAARWQE